MPHHLHSIHPDNSVFLNVTSSITGNWTIKLLCDYRNPHNHDIGKAWKLIFIEWKTKRMNIWIDGAIGIFCLFLHFCIDFAEKQKKN